MAAKKAAAKAAKAADICEDYGEAEPSAPSGASPYVSEAEDSTKAPDSTSGTENTEISKASDDKGLQSSGQASCKKLSAPGIKEKGSAKDRLRKRAEEKGLAVNNQDSDKGHDSYDSENPMSPPTDPKLIDMLQEANRTWPEDQKKATILYQLAARKGYLPAYVLLASRASEAKDNHLAMDTIFSLLLSENVMAMPIDTLSSYANQLAMLLRLPMYADVARQRKTDVERISVLFPVLKSVAQGWEAQDALAAIKSMQDTQVQQATSRTGVDRFARAKAEHDLKQTEEMVRAYCDGSPYNIGGLQSGGMDQNLMASLKKVCNPNSEPSGLGALDEQAAKLTFVFEAGGVGLGADWTTGLVTVVAEGEQAHRLGVRAGMRFLTVDGRPYTESRFDAARVGTESYEVTFAQACNPTTSDASATSATALKDQAVAKNDELATLLKQACNPGSTSSSCSPDLSSQVGADDLRESLKGLKLSALAHKAREVGVLESLLFDTLDDGTEAVIELIVQKVQQTAIAQACNPQLDPADVEAALEATKLASKQRKVTAADLFGPDFVEEEVIKEKVIKKVDERATTSKIQAVFGEKKFIKP